MSKLGDLEANDTWTRREYFPWHLKRFLVLNATKISKNVFDNDGKLLVFFQQLAKMSSKS